ncbi:MAG: hypothetical protein R3F54_11840 [Alphaproteobacteria bacterium]
MKRISLVLASTMLLASAGAAFATDTGGVKIQGTVNNDVYADDNYNTAYGSYARAYQSIGTIHSGTEVYGTLNNTVSASHNDNLAEGSEAVACQAIGSIGEFAPCQEGN